MSRAVILVAACVGLVAVAASGAAPTDAPLALVATCQGCVEHNGVLAVSAESVITLTVAGNPSPLTAYWIFGDGVVQDGGLTATHAYRPGTYTIYVYAFFKDAEPVVLTKDVLVTASPTILPKISNGNQIQQIALLVTAVISLLSLLYQIFIPA